jgi:very-short-patch-repair endonuclease
MLKLCDYGCKKEAIYQFKNGKYCCSENHRHCKGIQRKAGSSRIGRIPWNKGIKSSEETKIKQSIARKGVKKPPRTEIHKKRLSDATRGRKIPRNIVEKQRLKIIDLWRDPNSKYNSKEFREKLRKHMLNGHAVYANKCIKNPSAPEMILREIVKELHSNCESQYPVFNYALDVAIPDKKIAIEYDGYFHFDTEEHKQYHKIRQEKIEKEGWKFLRYTMFDKFPSSEQVKNDINKIIEGSK